jgi:hypothetical protein
VSALADAVRECLRRERGEEVVGLAPLPGGANSRALRVETRAGGVYLAKEYPADGSDRLGTEMAALGFLRRNGVRAVPEPVAALPGCRVGLFRFVAGEKLRPGEVGAAEVRAAAAFLGEVHALRDAPGAAALPDAKEACFTLEQHLAVVEGRLARLRALPAATGGPGRGLAAYLGERFAPFAAQVADRVRAAAARRGWDPRAELPPAARTLSPSDFGFHNALRTPSGELVFIDFEYFGWDDPAKTVADFYLQPAVPVPAALREPFYRAVRGHLGAGAGLEDRLPLVYPVLALKWCLIILNAFLRPGAGAGRERLLEGQLAKAEGHLARVREEYDNGTFPMVLGQEGRGA